MKKTRIIALVCIAVMLIAITAGCAGEPKKTFPSQTIEITCPYSPGGGSDTYGRAMADGFNRVFSQKTIVTNRTGGSGQVGAAFVLGKKNDPYSLMTINSGDISTWYNMDINIKSFKNIAITAWDINVLLVAGNSPYKTTADLVAAAKADPTKITLGGVSVGSDSHTLMLMLQESCGFQATYVPFDGGAEVTSALLGGHITCSWSNPSEAIGMIQSGDVRALGIAAEMRAESMPDVPTMKEQGYDVVFSQFRGLLAPPETPDAEVAILADAMKKVSESKEFKELAAKNYWEVQFLTGAEMTAVIDKQIAQIGKYKKP